MKKLVLVLVILVFGLFVFTSCNVPDEIKKKYETENTGGDQTKESGKDEEPDPDDRD